MKRFVLGLLFTMISVPASAQVITLSDTVQRNSISYPYYLQDRQASLRFEQVKKAKHHFEKAKDKVPDFLGNFSEAIWYRFEVENKSGTSEWFLEIKGGFMHELTVYQLSANGKVQSLTLSGDHRSRKAPVFSNNVIFPITLSDDVKNEIYIRATSKTLIRTSMQLCTMQQLYEDTLFGSYGDGFFTAIAVALLLYNLFVYFSLREKVYLYYIGYISTAILHTNIVAGHLQIFVPWVDWINTTTILPIISVFSILFTNSFLQTQQYAPFIYKIRKPLMVICMSPLFCYAFGWYKLAILLAAILIFTLFVYWILAGFIAYKNGFAPAVYYLIGFGALVAMSVVFEFKMRGFLEENYWTDSSLFIGAAIEAVILSFALADKFNFYKKEKERLQEEAYLQAIHFSRELINMQEAERKRIASELHDSLGQKLVLIKNKILRSTPFKANAPQQPDDTLSHNVAEAIQEIRNISYALRPYQLDLLGLTSSVKSMVSESFDVAQIDYTISLDNIDALFDNEGQINVYRIIQECIHNIIKHAQAKNVAIAIKSQDNGVKIAISDDGIGFDTNENHTGFGLKGIKERLQILGGTMAIASRKNETAFEFLIPGKK
ncbi:7TM diverse intracellular signaling domain-containing protein [Flavobacterium sp.]|uniref:sensor histidine kinase n=1 Tax=Flavobacterium sp. TaxID=239 RepID=UPI0039E53208